MNPRFCPLNALFIPVKGPGLVKVLSQGNVSRPTGISGDWQNKFFAGKV